MIAKQIHPNQVQNSTEALGESLMCDATARAMTGDIGLDQEIRGTDGGRGAGLETVVIVTVKGESEIKADEG